LESDAIIEGSEVKEYKKNKKKKKKKEKKKKKLVPFFQKIFWRKKIIFLFSFSFFTFLLLFLPPKHGMCSFALSLPSPSPPFFFS